MPTTKIATCSYCGTRAALVLDRGRHELSCASCGAPLHEMKALHAGRPDLPTRRHRDGSDVPAPHRVMREPKHAKAKKAKRRKGLARRFFEEAFDVLEDIFD